ncbi:MAG: hypothetical protein IPK64_05860 [bacterium]|nr:hypothetical protein [bacterium]
MSSATAPGRRAAAIAGVVVALALGLAWPNLHPAGPLLPTDDLYSHLSVARHLVRGDGFLCDVTYPLSFAWPWARALPQPLAHRPPAWPVVLALPYAMAGPDPAAVVTAVGVLQRGLLALAAGLGTAAWIRRGRPGAAAAWVVALTACPLLPYVVDWGHTELPAAVLLLGCWLRYREGTLTPGPLDGAITAALALLRPELAWLPLAWWAWLKRPSPGSDGRSGRRGLLVALAVALALVAPWLARNVRVTGDPFFSVQAAAELAKDTRRWPGYDVYRQLEPQPPWRALREYPEAVARKTARGLRFYAQEFPSLLPWAVPVLLLVGVAAGLRAPARRTRGPAATAALSAVALAILYAPLDHSLRHLVAIAPVLAWEAAPWLGEWPWTLLPARLIRWRRAPATVLVAAVLVALPLAELTRREPTGWASSAQAAATRVDASLAEAARLRALPADDTAFTDSAAAIWLADRPAVWSPLDAQVANRIAAWLAPTAGGPGAP